MKLRKYDIVWLNLNPTKGSEQQGFRPCLVLQNNLANQSHLPTVCIAIFTSNLKSTPAGVLVKKSAVNGLKTDSRLELSQIRTIDKDRIKKKIGALESIYYPELRCKLSDFLDINDEF